jgi:hypothetical protein
MMNPTQVAQMNAENVEAIHWLTWPIRFVVGLIKTALFLVIFIVAVPLLFAGLVLHFVITGHTMLDADSVLALKVIITFVMPFAVSIVYRIAQWNNKRDYSVGNHQVFFIGLGLVLLGLLAYPAWDGMKTELGLMALVMYQGSPLLLLLAKRAPKAPERIAGVRPNGEVAVW